MIRRFQRRQAPAQVPGGLRQVAADAIGRTEQPMRQGFFELRLLGLHPGGGRIKGSDHGEWSWGLFCLI